MVGVWCSEAGSKTCRIEGSAYLLLTTYYLLPTRPAGSKGPTLASVTGATGSSNRPAAGDQTNVLAERRCGPGRRGRQAGASRASKAASNVAWSSYCLLLTTYYSLLTTYYLLLTRPPAMQRGLRSAESCTAGKTAIAAYY